jgi:dipeptidyl aminopeptidase/acylaminoacyl peptidase
MDDMKRLRRLLVAAGIGVVAGTALASIFAAEGAVHIWIRPQPDRHEADAVVARSDASWQPARATAADGTALDGWLFRPARPNGAGAILLHGVGDTRAGVRDEAAFLIRAGYTVLTPDARGHGASGGDVITYGIRESGDVHAWGEWLFANGLVDRLYGLGESMGAAILLESLAREPRFRAVVAEAPFAEFREVAYDRLAQKTTLPPLLFLPIIDCGVIYGRLRYGVDLNQASPAAAVRATSVPILLIHGTEDHNIPIRHSRELHALNPASTVLWEVPHGRHVDALATTGNEYVARVLDWFASH